jgi:hypothetical protein
MVSTRLKVKPGLHRDITVNDIPFTIGYASGEGCNCLISTINQLLRTCVDSRLVREDLKRKFPHGPDKVTEGNFLDFDVHWAAIVESLGRHSETLPGGLRSLNPSRMQVACVDLVFIGQGATICNPNGQRFYLAREHANHFVPLIRKQSR